MFRANTRRFKYRVSPKQREMDRSAKKGSGNNAAGAVSTPTLRPMLESEPAASPSALVKSSKRIRVFAGQDAHLCAGILIVTDDDEHNTGDRDDERSAESCHVLASLNRVIMDREAPGTSLLLCRDIMGRTQSLQLPEQSHDFATRSQSAKPMSFWEKLQKYR